MLAGLFLVALSAFAAAAPTSGTPPSGTVFWNVISNGAQNSCLIDNGKWVGNNGTCAGYTIHYKSASTFTMSTTNGNCQISSIGFLTCASGLQASTWGVDSMNHLFSGDSSDYFASEVPQTQENSTLISTESNTYPLKLQYGADTSA